MSKLLIKNGSVVDPASGIDGPFDIYVVDGKIVEIKGVEGARGRGGKGKLEPLNPGTLEPLIIDATGLFVFPGFIDLHTHLREPGYEYKETIKTGTEAAAAGGFTSIVCMANTDPPNDNSSVTRYIIKRAAEEGCVNVFPVGALSKGLKGEVLSEAGELKSAGVVALSDDGRPVMDGGFMRRGLEYAKAFGLPIISHCEDLTITGDGIMNEGFTSTRLGLKGIPKASEEVMVTRDIALTALTGGRLHIAHVSTNGSVELIRRAKERGIRVSAEVTPHHLTLTDEVVIGYNTNVKMNPPLREADDIEALKGGLKDGTIDCIATDHAPQSPIEKDVEFDRAENGVVGLETALPLVLRLVDEGVLTLAKAIEKLTINPARVLGLAKGTLKVGADADITIVDLNKEWVVDSSSFKSKGRNTPFEGWRMKGRVVKTIVGGRVVYE